MPEVITHEMCWLVLFVCGWVKGYCWHFEDICFFSTSESLMHQWLASAGSFFPSLRAEPFFKDPKPWRKDYPLMLFWRLLLATSFWHTVACSYLSRPCLKPNGREDMSESSLGKKRGQLALGADGWRVIGERGPCHQGVASWPRAGLKECYIPHPPNPKQSCLILLYRTWSWPPRHHRPLTSLPKPAQSSAASYCISLVHLLPSNTFLFIRTITSPYTLAPETASC